MLGIQTIFKATPLWSLVSLNMYKSHEPRPKPKSKLQIIGGLIITFWGQGFVVGDYQHLGARLLATSYWIMFKNIGAASHPSTRQMLKSRIGNPYNTRLNFISTAPQPRSDKRGRWKKARSLVQLKSTSPGRRKHSTGQIVCPLIGFSLVCVVHSEHRNEGLLSQTRFHKWM